MPEKSRLTGLSLISLLLLAAVVIFLLILKKGDHRTRADTEGDSVQALSDDSQDGGSGTVQTMVPEVGALESGSEIDNRSPKPTFRQNLSNDELLASLFEAKRLLERNGITVDEIKGILARLGAELKNAQKERAVAATLDFLKSGQDAATGLGFELALGGVLAEPPTLRVAALDWLGQIDVAAAEAYGSEWMDAPRSGDEWAIGMRNISWSAPDGSRKGELVKRFHTALDRGDWAAEPSAGFLEAFDLAPFVGGGELLNRLADINGRDLTGSLGWASLLALDRMLLADRVAVLTALSSTPNLMGGNPQARAGMMARADVRIEEERQALELYLRRVDVTASEAAAFGSLYPNANLIAGHRLFTRADGEGRPMADVANGDIAALDRLGEWESDSSVAPEFRQILPRIRERLTEHVASARRAAANGDFQLND